MKKLYQKSELGFSLVWIGLYVVLFSAADTISESLGIVKAVTAPLCVGLTVLLLAWVKQNHLEEKYGLIKVRSPGKYLYFLPLVLIPSVNLWGGLTLRFTPLESALYAVSMLCVGFLEELIFRGFLFRALCKDSIKTAVVVSSLTFGLGHIVNLLNGAAFLETLLQICYAIAIGFLFTVIVCTGKSLLPCIVTHSTINILSTFAVEADTAVNMLAAIFLILVSASYALWLLKQTDVRLV